MLAIVLRGAEDREKSELWRLRELEATLINLLSDARITTKELMGEEVERYEFESASDLAEIVKQREDARLEEESVGWVGRLLGDEVQA